MLFLCYINVLSLEVLGNEDKNDNKYHGQFNIIEKVCQYGNLHCCKAYTF